jgi:hypothetical protein
MGFSGSGAFRDGERATPAGSRTSSQALNKVCPLLFYGAIIASQMAILVIRVPVVMMGRGLLRHSQLCAGLRRGQCIYLQGHDVT